ncbi:endonuclease/exonuclease/phosphatase family protein [Agarivorans sp.]|uniref:endonuclease/exonuclease/phosphatase family protein n=1 Tax=Agarivorans sp. TaxID=1872412 RepID=UPI003D060A15
MTSIRMVTKSLYYLLLSLIISFGAAAQLPACDNQQLNYQPASPEHLQVLPDVNDFSVLVWNTYKGKNSSWHQQFTDFSQNIDFMLLQEVSLRQVDAWPYNAQWFRYQAMAFEWQGDQLGVMNLAKFASDKSCLLLSPEPWIRLPKSALLQLYRWQDRELLVINIHSINFTLGDQDYRQQLQQLQSWLNRYQGAMILAGDFNTWSQGRLTVLQQFVARQQLKTANFEPDLRSHFFGETLDHVFYRGLELKASTSIATEASDHNALVLRFGFIKR